jgi:RNA polymerase sigma-70 factor (ECF subfamily)
MWATTALEFPTMTAAPGRPDDLALLATVELVRRAQDGDRSAHEQLASRFVKPLRRWAAGRLPAYARRMIETDDLVQDALLKTMQRLPHLRSRQPGGFQSYLRQAVLNRIRDELRRIAARPLAGEPPTELVAEAPSPLEQLLTRESLQRYDAALARLRPFEREAILARVELGFDFAQIAALLGKPSADAARMAVSRAVLRLAEELARERRI